jgi:hypothetical protein
LDDDDAGCNINIMRRQHQRHQQACMRIAAAALILAVLVATAAPALHWRWGAAGQVGITFVVGARESPPWSTHDGGDDIRENDGTCASFRSSQLHGAISQKRAADIVRRLVSDEGAADAETCPVFFRNYQDKEPYTSWTPWQPEETLMRWSHQLTCQNAEFCEELYNLDDTATISQLIYDHQHPRDCSQSKFLIIESEWHAGFGSTIHIKAYSVLIALMSNRVLIDSPDIQWTMTFAATCESQDWACYFAPLTNCTLPNKWRSTAVAFTSVKGQSNDQYVFSSAAMNLADAPGIGNVKLDIDWFGSSAFNTKPASWWMTQATGYVARPNERTLRAVCYIWDCIVGSGQNKQQPQRPFAAMFIRRGDKWWESRLREPFEYFDLLEGLDRNLSEPIKTVYVGTDDPKMLSQIVHEYSSDWDLTWMGYHRSSQGSQHHEEVARYHTAKMELQVLLTLAEVFISASADVLVGTLSSNQCRLMDELRKLQGKGRMPYLTPENELIAGQRR